MGNPETTWLYFHSAVFQGDMALLAFVGVFVVFKLQQVSSNLQTQFRNIDAFVRDTMRNPDGSSIAVSFHDVPSLKEEIDRIAKLGLGSSVHARDKAIDLKRDGRYPRGIDVYERTGEGRKKIIHLFCLPVGFLFVAISGSLLALPRYDSLTSRCCTAIDVFILFNFATFLVNVLYVLWVVGQTGASAERFRRTDPSGSEAGK